MSRFLQRQLGRPPDDCFCRFATSLILSLATVSCTAAPQLLLTQVGDAYSTDVIEIRGVAAGAFDERLWRENTLNLVRDVRAPLLAPREGKWRNIYAPSAVETTSGQILFYGAWDGVATGNDRIYMTTTTDFLEFGPRETLIEHGDFQHVCNVNAIPDARRSGFDLVTTVYPDKDGLNKPALFHFDDAPGNRMAPKVATPNDIVRISGYDGYARADINGMNVLLRDRGKLRLFFGNFSRHEGVHRASHVSGKEFTYDGIALPEPLAVNDVKSFVRVAGKTRYLMGLHMNRGFVKFSLSTDGEKFEPSQVLFQSGGAEERYIVAVGWVTQGAQEESGRRLLGVLYGAGPAPSLDKNSIFARWLQKRIEVAAEGEKLEVIGAYGPDRVLLRNLRGRDGDCNVTMFAEDGTSLLGRAEGAKIRAGTAYNIKAGKDGGDTK